MTGQVLLLSSLASLPDSYVPPGFTATVWASRLKDPRGVALGANGDVLVVERDRGCVTALWDGGTERASVACTRGLNHGVAVCGSYLFASSETTVYRWAYAGQRADLGKATTVIKELSAGTADELGARGGHSTRTLLCNGDRLFISVGSEGNIDDDDFRARIRYVDGLVSGSTEGPLSFSDLRTWARGVRNTVGLGFDAKGVLHGVNNGPDNLRRSDVGGDIHNDNPGEELNRFASLERRTYGYPHCWSKGPTGKEPKGQPGSQWAWPSSMPEYDDDWCRNPDNVVPPTAVMKAHTAPLGLAFFGAREALAGTPAVCQGAGSKAAAPDAFPCDWLGQLFVAQHGSWNRDTPVGYAVVRLAVADDGSPTGDVVPLLRHAGDDAKWPDGLRPVDPVFLEDGSLLVSSDTTGELVRITYAAGPPIVADDGGDPFAPASPEEERRPVPVATAGAESSA